MYKFVNYVKAVWYADVYVPLHYCWFSHQLKVMGGGRNCRQDYQ